MALIEFNSINLTVNVKVGILETYKPDKDIKKIVYDVNLLKKKIKKEMSEIFGTTNVGVAKDILDKDKKINKQWSKFAKNAYLNILAIQKRINKKNKEICPGFSNYAKRSNK